MQVSPIWLRPRRGPKSRSRKQVPPPNFFWKNPGSSPMMMEIRSTNALVKTGFAWNFQLFANCLGEIHTLWILEAVPSSQCRLIHVYIETVMWCISYQRLSCSLAVKYYYCNGINLDWLKVCSYYAAIVLHCRTAPSCTELALTALWCHLKV